MSLTQVEKARIADSRMKIKSVASSLQQVDPAKIEHFDEIQNCLEGAEQSLSDALDDDVRPSGLS